MSRLLRIVVEVVLTAVLGVLLVVFLLAATPPGSAWLLGNAGRLSGGIVTVDGVTGTLVTGLHADQVMVRTESVTLGITDLDVALAWPAMLRKRVTISRARAAALLVAVGPSSDPDVPVAPLLLAFPLDAEDLEIARLEVTQGGNTVLVANIRLQGALVRGVVTVDSAAATLYGIEARARGTFGTGEPFALDAKLDWTLPELAVSGAGGAHGSLADLHFDQAVRLPDLVQVTGRALLLADQPSLDVAADWQRVTQAVPGAGVFVSDGGRLTLRGWLDRFDAELAGGLALDKWPRVSLKATATGDTRAAHFGAVRIDGLEGSLTGAGDLAYADGVSGRFDFAGRGLNPGGLDSRLAGRVDLAGQLAFGPGDEFSVKLDRAAGQLFRRPFRASGAVARKGPAFEFTNVNVLAGGNHAELSGTFGPTIAGRFRIDAPDLPTLWPDLQGHLRGHGEIGGTVARPVFSLDVEGSALGMGPARIARLSAHGGLGRQNALDLDVDAAGLALAGNAVGDLAVGAVGTLANHQVHAELTGGQVSLRLAGDGTFARGVLQESFRAGSVAAPGGQLWHLRDAAILRVAGSNLFLAANCWNFAAAELCLDEARSDQRGFAAGLHLRHFPVQVLAGYLPPDLKLTGTADVDLEGHREDGSLSGRLSWEQRDTALAYRVEEGEDISTKLTEFRVAVTVTDAALDWQAIVAESYGTQLATSGRILDPLGPDPTIAGTVSGEVPDLARLSPVVEHIADVNDLQGRIVLKATLAGSAGKPAIRGGLELAGGALAVPVAGIVVDHIGLAVTGREDGTAEVRGGARSGKGFAELSGNLAWRNSALPSAELRLRGRQFQVLRLPEGVVQVSPDVGIVLADGQFRVGGKVQVPKAAIVIKKLSASAVQTSPDVVVHGRAAAAGANRRPLFVLDGLNVLLGRDVTFDGFGLTTHVEGQVALSQSLAADPFAVTADGVLRLEEGKFAALGQELEIDRGTLAFAGIATDPYLDVRASRVVNYEGRDVTAGVLVTGNLSRLETRVFTEPAMGEMDALSYLTTGKPLSAAGMGDRSSVSSAALSLGMYGAMPVAQKLGEALSVDEVGMEGSDADTSAVYVGEQVGKDLYIRYSYGIFNNLGTIKATYKLSRRFSIEGSSGAAQALDLIYSINW